MSSKQLAALIVSRLDEVRDTKGKLFAAMQGEALPLTNGRFVTGAELNAYAAGMVRGIQALARQYAQRLEEPERSEFLAACGKCLDYDETFW